MSMTTFNKVHRVLSWILQLGGGEAVGVPHSHLISFTFLGFSKS